MPSLLRLLFIAPAILAVVNAQGVLLTAQGTKGTPASLGLQVENNTATDANIINDGEITTNVVNECGRTVLGGNIDIGTVTEAALVAKTVTSVTKGGKLDITIKQINASGAGPYTCDIDLTSNADGVTGQTNLTLTETDGADGTIKLSATLPADMQCVGASTGNICTVRCRNSNAAGPFGGCVAVQQTDVTANANTPETIKTAQTLAGISAQVLQNQKDLGVAVKAIAGAKGTDQAQALAAATALLAAQGKKVARRMMRAFHA